MAKKLFTKSKAQSSNVETPAQQGSTPPNSWICKKCGAINPSSTLSCKECGAYK